MTNHLFISLAGWLIVSLLSTLRYIALTNKVQRQSLPLFFGMAILFGLFSGALSLYLLLYKNGFDNAYFVSLMVTFVGASVGAVIARKLERCRKQKQWW